MPNVDLSSVSAAQAREALALAARTLDVEVARGMNMIRRGRGVVVIDASDLATVGQVAAVAAVVTYDASRGATLQTWIRTQVRWWIRKSVNIILEIARRESVICDPATTLANQVSDAFADGFRGGLLWDTVALVADEGPNQEDRLADEQGRAAVVRLAAETLSPRERVIVERRLAGSGETGTAIAESFGVDRAQVSRELQSAVRKLSNALNRGVAA